MFVVKQNTTFKWPVRAETPVDGKREPVEFMAEFRVVNHEDVVENGEVTPTQKMRAALVDFEGEVLDANGNPVTDPAARCEIIIAQSNYLDALSTAFAEGLLGYERKN